MGTREELLRKRQLRDEGVDPYATPATVDENEQKLDELKAKAKEVGVTHAAFEEAIMEERDVAAKLIQRAIEDIAPALPALVGKLEAESVKKTTESVVMGKSPAQQINMAQVSQTHHDKRGLILVDKFHAVQQERDISGTYGGISLYLLEGGILAFGHREGSWSRVPGEFSVLRLALTEVDVDTAIVRFRIDQILAGMAAALNSQDGLAGATEKVRARAAKLAVALNAINDMLR